MAEFTLTIGNKAYSSWSLRGWLPLKHAGVAFEEVVIPLEPTGVPTKAIRERSPSGRVPFLRHGDLLVWDSLAIAEYVAELFPEIGLWPSDARARATARSVSAEVHSGFAALRSALPMNVRRKPSALPLTTEVEADVARILAIWTECRHAYGEGGPFLFGSFTNADVMFAPVATRFRTYGVPLDGGAHAYVEAIFALPSMREWIAAAERETWRIEGYERVGM
jgi:glutathione S-transferase